ncbi:CHAT domain-containing protein [Portibacter marinus]|uniref:CHAT domain-containing protein n=1 Tax=Portibacter marinus TaxID=2898660 RepID=UPI001F3AD312|nr:CHAT domain-containing tetratricopeptide repeat protein [Portibacter marinus]
MKYFTLLIFLSLGVTGQTIINPDMAEALYDRGKDIYYEARYDEALAILDSAYTMAASLIPQSEKLLVSITHRLGNAALKAKKYEASNQYLEEALERAKKYYGPQSERVAGVYNDLGNLYGAMHLYNRSMAYFQQSISIEETISGKNSVEVAYIKMNKAGNFYSLGNYSKCIEEYQKVLKIYNEHLKPDHENYNRVYLTLSSAYRKKGDVNGAVEYAMKALDIKLKNYPDDHPSVAKYFMNVGKALVDAGKPEEAENYFLKAQHIVQSVGDAEDLGDYINDAARIYQANGDVEVALDQFENARKIIASEGLSTYAIDYNRAICLYALEEKERAYQLMQQISEGREDAQNQLRLSKWAGRLGYPDAAKEYLNRGKGLLNEGDELKAIEYKVQEAVIIANENLEESWQLIQAAIGDFVKKRRYYSGRESKEFINDELAGVFDFAVELAVKRYEEDFQNNSLLEDLYKIIEQAKAASFWDDQSEDNAHYYGGVPPDLLDEIDRLQQDGIDSRVELEEKMDKLENDYPEYYRQKYSLAVPEIKQILDNLGDDMVIIDYYVLHDQIIGIVIGESNFHLIQYADKDNFDFSKELAILKPDIERISIIPHDFLYFTSFDGIRHPVEGHFLIYDYAFSYQVNIQGLLNSHNSYKEVRYMGLVPEWSGLADDLVASRSDLVPLPGAKIEVEEVASLFGGKVYKNEDASERIFVSQAPHFSLIHLATHAMVDPVNELNSALFLQPENEEETGKLEMDEIMDMDLNADMIILSACETGAGALQSGEGVMSLARAFQYAGAKSVLMSLWRANDQSAHPIILEFMKNYKKGMTKDVALQQSKIKFLENADPLLKDKFYWAGFMISGDVGSMSLGRTHIWWWIGASLILLLMILVSLKLRAKVTQ